MAKLKNSERHRAGISRRRFCTSVVAAAGLAGTRLTAQQGATALPQPGNSGIEHVVLITMENRSFDHLMGWLPGANGRQAGLRYPDLTGQFQTTYPLTDYQGCAYKDPDHSYEGGRVEFDNGKCDGWLRVNDRFSVGYYKESDLAFLGAAAPGWTVCDGYFAAIMAETYPNRIYQHAAQTDRIHNSTTISGLPTIWDQLEAAGLSGKYYFSDVPFLALWGSRYASISRPFGEFLTDCATGNLAHVSYVDPRFVDETSGTSNDDHPHADIRNGETFLNQVYAAVTRSPQWASTVLVITYDEWGGFFDHIPPPTAPIPAADQAAGNQDGRLGFRVPTLVISPWSRRGYVSHVAFDHTSALKLIEWRWGLQPLTVRDAGANNLAYALNFRQQNVEAPAYPVPSGMFGFPCASTVPSEEQAAWSTLKTYAQQYGFPV